MSAGRRTIKKIEKAGNYFKFIRFIFLYEVNYNILLGVDPTLLT